MVNIIKFWSFFAGNKAWSDEVSENILEGIVDQVGTVSQDSELRVDLYGEAPAMSSRSMKL